MRAGGDGFSFLYPSYALGQGLLDEVQWCIRKRHEQEMNLAFRSKKDDAKAQFYKLQRAEDGKKALSEYEAEAVAVRAKTARLRALRLARDAAAQTAAAAQPAVAKKKPAKAAKPAKEKSADLAQWLDVQKTG